MEYDKFEEAEASTSKNVDNVNIASSTNIRERYEIGSRASSESYRTSSLCSNCRVIKARKHKASSYSSEDSKSAHKKRENSKFAAKKRKRDSDRVEKRSTPRRKLNRRRRETRRCNPSNRRNYRRYTGSLMNYSRGNREMEPIFQEQPRNCETEPTIQEHPGNSETEPITQEHPESAGREESSRSLMQSPLCENNSTTSTAIETDAPDVPESTQCYSEITPEMIHDALLTLTMWRHEVETMDVFDYIKKKYPVCQDNPALYEELEQKLVAAVFAGIAQRSPSGCWQTACDLMQRSLPPNHVTMFWEFYADTMTPITKDTLSKEPDGNEEKREPRTLSNHLNLTYFT